MHELRSASAPSLRLHRSVLEAETGTDLGKAAEEIESVLRSGEVSQSEHDRLLLEAAKQARRLPHSIEDMPLSVFAISGLVRTVRSNVLGETVLWAADNAVVPDEGGQVVYRASELQQLVGRTPAEIRAIHFVKNILDGEVIERDENAATIFAGVR